MPRSDPFAAVAGDDRSRPLREGARLGRYVIARHLATGGMSELYLARSRGIEGFEKTVVVKRILPQFASDPAYIAMFLDEARLAATLHHQNIAQIFDIGEDRGQYFFAQEFVRGRDLDEILRRVMRGDGEVDYGVAVGIVTGAAAGLYYAHEKRDADGNPCHIVHCDVSPANVIVSYEGGIKLIDFGIAEAAANRGGQTGTIKGKASYLAPEQVEGAALDHRADVFALGILLYELTTQSRLFVGESWVAVLEQVRQCAIPPPSSRRPGFPRALEAILRGALAREPDRRYPTAQALALDLERYASESKQVTSSFRVSSWMRELFDDADEAPPPLQRPTGRGEELVRSRSADDHQRSRTSIEWGDETGEVPLSSRRPIAAPTATEPRRSGRPLAWIGGGLAAAAAIGGLLAPQMFAGAGDVLARPPALAPPPTVELPRVSAPMALEVAVIEPAPAVEPAASPEAPPEGFEPPEKVEPAAAADDEIAEELPRERPAARSRRERASERPPRPRREKKDDEADEASPAPRPDPPPEPGWSKDSPFLPE